ncbi:domain found in IF2B/IF5-domain-containing protein [Obelidium mucronatum]|nr:domain found in IF2B/IF5-domain-containing protein [Obelidium mucronatum]
MSNMINVRSDVQDKFYRYKMPKIVSKIEGKGNGIKTVIPNMADVSKALSRPPAYATKYFGIELGAQTKVEEKTDRYIVNGAHDANKLQQVLDGFITKFVLCPSCKNPETDLIIQKDETITRNCNACGANLPVDLRHKLCVFIIKNPPAISNATAKARAAADKATDRSMNLGGASSGAAKADDNADDNADDEDGDAALDEFAAFTEEILAAEDPEAEIQIIDKASELGIKDSKAIIILMMILFTKEMLLASQIKNHASLLHFFVKNEKSQKALLGGIETFITRDEDVKNALYNKVSLILKAFYDEELLEEDVVLAWADKPTKKYVDKKVAKDIREKAEPFLHWLREAEVGDDDDM